MNDLTKKFFVELKHPVTGQIVNYPGDYEQKHLDSAVKYKAKAKDVFICSYPKSGSTWIQVIVWSIIHQGENFDLKNIRDSIPMLEYDGHEATEEIAARENPLIIKTHLPYEIVPKHPDAKYIFIVRNPKDVAVSYYYHFKGVLKLYDCMEFTLNNFFGRFAEGRLAFGSFFDYVVPWYENRHQPNFLFLVYEDLKKDPRSNVLKISKFLNKDYQKRLENNNKILEEILQRISFDWMKSAPTKWASLSVLICLKVLIKQRKLLVIGKRVCTSGQFKLCEVYSYSSRYFMKT